MRRNSPRKTPPEPVNTVKISVEIETRQSAEEVKKEIEWAIKESREIETQYYSDRGIDYSEFVNAGSILELIRDNMEVEQ